MYTVHVVMAVAAALVGVIALVATGGRRDERIVTLVACAALVVGHLASLSSAAPEWYSAGVVLASIAGFGWVMWTLSAALAGLRTPPDIADGAPRGRPRLRLVGATAADARTLPALPATATPTTDDEPSRHVTRAQVLSAGPEGAEKTAGATYVAANFVDYVNARSGTAIARAHRRTAHRSAAIPALSPEQRLRALRIRAAYGQVGSTGEGRDYRA